MTSIESKISVSEDKIKAIFNNMPFPSYIWQKVRDDLVLIDYNYAAEKATKGEIKNFLHERASYFYKNKPELLEELYKCISEKGSNIKELKYKMNTTSEELFLSIKYYFIPPDLVLVHTEDISKGKLIRKDFDKSEAKFRHLFNHSPFAVVLVNLKGEIVEVNDSTVKFFGFQKEELIGKNYLELNVYPPKYLSILQSRFQKIIEGDLLEPIELKVKKKDGNKSWIHSRMSILKLGNKKFLHTIIMDITEQKNFEETIKRKLKIEKFLSTISSRFIGNVDIDMTINLSLVEMGKLIEANRAYLLLFNEENSLEFFTQQWCSEETEPENLDSMVIHVEKYPWCLKQCSEHGFVYISDIFELPKEAESTKQKLESLNIKSFLAFPVNIKGKLYGFIGFDNIDKMRYWSKDDFSLLKTSSEIIGSALDRKWAEQTLKGSNQLLGGIISSLTDSICLIDKGFNILWVNNVVNNQFDSQIIRKKCYEAFLGGKKPCKNCIAKKTFSDGKIHEIELKLININGIQINHWCTSSSAALSNEGHTELAVLIFRDISNKVFQ